MIHPASVASWKERWISAPTGGESPVRDAAALATLLPTGQRGQWQWSHFRSNEVGERGGQCPALMGTTKRSTLNSAVYKTLSDRGQDLRNKHCLALVLI